MLFIMTLLLMDNPNDLEQARKHNANSSKSSSTKKISPDSIANPSHQTLTTHHTYNNLITSSIHSHYLTTPVYASMLELEHDIKLRNSTKQVLPNFGPVSKILDSEPVKNKNPLYPKLEENKLPGPFQNMKVEINRDSKNVPLTATEGRIAMQLYSKNLAGITEISLVRGLIKMYDGVSGGGNRDVLVYCLGVLVGGIGRVSLVGNWGEGWAVVEVEGVGGGVRRLVEEEVGANILNSWEADDNDLFEQFNRNDGWIKYLDSGDTDTIFQVPTFDFDFNFEWPFSQAQDQDQRRRTSTVPKTLKSTPTPSSTPEPPKPESPKPTTSTSLSTIPLSTLPFPTTTIVSPLERSHLKNVHGCPFLITLQSSPELYTSAEIAKTKLSKEQLRTSTDNLEKQPYVMRLSGDIVSEPCNLAYNVTTTAIR
ncbi:hypothetical protein TL16_g10836 [Triparma laevis f. inornata]|uniref:Uncharacterized protein n=1 Tax=Triparma laevis f. inornata TaxID=1714386 RepID=A0A9W7BAJ0_9STRA|nr:hypothetical protein TL16_g10836 [Triparma laevis f. inornata]